MSDHYPPPCPSCGNPVELDYIESMGIDGIMRRIPGKWTCNRPGCPERLAAMFATKKTEETA